MTSASITTCIRPTAIWRSTSALPVGNYRATLPGGVIEDAYGRVIGGDGFSFEFSVLAGDFDANGLVDDRDIDLLLVQIGLANHPVAYDLTGDMSVDGADATYLVETILATNFGDANLDGLVNATDTAILTANFGWTGGAAWHRGNFNGDAAIDLIDLAILQSQLGSGVPVASPAAPQAVFATRLAPHSRANPRRDDPVTMRATRQSRQTSWPNSTGVSASSSDAGGATASIIGQRVTRRPRLPSAETTSQLPASVVDALLTETN
jgi:hypothetical protein